ncbi:hypothetical protein PAXRUDRAFT_237163 [Paxillus rubicundulus Ve08.2h10]|uniref:Uncharacterized protein n=1 Tax=Paxillus rubicundulus Ve08.2h10 TaxID=930991 RepID=A0A0D0DNH9_9AGAM|nr:hypothetical protein PAXRUDRAFT_237163 [Paxillus rubicundulus Ve08.2h10]
MASKAHQSISPDPLTILKGVYRLTCVPLSLGYPWLTMSLVNKTRTSRHVTAFPLFSHLHLLGYDTPLQKCQRPHKCQVAIQNPTSSLRNVDLREGSLFMLSRSTSRHATTTYPSRTREIRCMDLGGEALGSYKARQGGCTQIQFFNESSGNLKCTNSECAMEFSKASLQDNAYIQIQGLPA